MASQNKPLAAHESAITDGWELASLSAGRAATPSDIPNDALWIRATAPGTVAGALQHALSCSPEGLNNLHKDDHWFRTKFVSQGSETLRLHGLASIASVWLNNEKVLFSDNMFCSHDISVNLIGPNTLYICFHALTNHLKNHTSAGRWRPRMITPSSLRHVRTTALGHMSGWCPDVDIIGPWRPIERISDAQRDTTSANIRTHLNGSTGVLAVTLPAATISAAATSIECSGQTATFVPYDASTARATLEIPDVERWWPHTHGTPALHDVTLTRGSERHTLGRVGFRTLRVDRDTDGCGFGLVVNNLPIFCRGAVWITPDIINLPQQREQLAPMLEAARNGGMNMLRIPGTALYESEDFFALCDELGILVWHDFMFANFDYPTTDPEFEASVRREASQFLQRSQAHPALAVLCGGSEVYQQAAVLGLPPRKYQNPLFDQWLPDLVATHRPDVPYVTNSPSGGPLPFVVDEGVGHYFGVGAYKRPLSDARTANVRFASECLAFAQVPPEITNSNGADDHHEQPITGVHDSRWAERIPRDAGSPWNFEDVRDHYTEEIFGIHAAALRYEDPERYLNLSRAAQAEVSERTYSEWLRAASPTRGALTLMLQDLHAGAGWGILTSCGAPKSSYYAMKRVFKPVRVIYTDEGVNGLALHVANETATPQRVLLTLAAFRDGRTQVLKAKRELDLAPRSNQTLSAYNLIGTFFDINYSYRFQPPQHDTTVISLTDRDTGALVSEAIHFPLGHARNCPEASLSIRVAHDAERWTLVISTDKAARFVSICDQNFVPEDDWFHLPPNTERIIALHPRKSGSNIPQGTVSALNLRSRLSYMSSR